MILTKVKIIHFVEYCLEDFCGPMKKELEINRTSFENLNCHARDQLAINDHMS